MIDWPACYHTAHMEKNYIFIYNRIHFSVKKHNPECRFKISKPIIIGNWKIRGEERSRLSCISTEPREHTAGPSPACVETPQIGPRLQFPHKHAHTHTHTHTGTHTHTVTLNSDPTNRMCIYKHEFHRRTVNMDMHSQHRGVALHVMLKCLSSQSSIQATDEVFLTQTQRKWKYICF